MGREALAELDHDLERVLLSYLDAIGVGYERRRQGERETILIAPSPALPTQSRWRTSATKPAGA